VELFGTLGFFGPSPRGSGSSPMDYAKLTTLPKCEVEREKFQIPPILNIFEFLLI